MLYLSSCGYNKSYPFLDVTDSSSIDSSFSSSSDEEMGHKGHGQNSVLKALAMDGWYNNCLPPESIDKFKEIYQTLICMLMRGRLTHLNKNVHGKEILFLTLNPSTIHLWC